MNRTPCRRPSRSSARWFAVLAGALCAGAALAQPVTPPRPATAPTASPPPAPGSTATPAAARLEMKRIQVESGGGFDLLYLVSTPAGFKTGDVAPVAIVLPPGNQSSQMVNAAVNYFLPASDAQGWVVVSPVAPTINGTIKDFTSGGEAAIPALLRDLRTWVRPEGNKFHLAGISRGGLSAFHVGPAFASEWHSITVMPGFVLPADQGNLGKLAGIPIRAFVGSDDTVTWTDGLERLKEDGERLKLNLQATRVNGQGHMIGSLARGKILDVINPLRVKENTLDETSAQVALALDDFHDAASKAEEARYFAHFAPEGVFIGTDATERWNVEQFRAYARPLFMKGKGWTYKPRLRNITMSPDKTVAWFDEILDNEKYGTCRGSGVLRLENGKWLITQYHLTVPVPNELLDRVATMIRNAPKPKAK